jgi:hypothetical protein
MKKPYWVVTLAATLMGVILMVVEITATAAPPTGTKNVVLVLGAFADGSGREAVAKILEKDGHTVPVAQPPETSYADDQKYTRAAIDAMGGPAVVVAHSAGRVPLHGPVPGADLHRLVYSQGDVARLEDQARLVHGGHRRPVDLSEPGAHDGEARQCQDGRSECQRCGLYVSS